MTGLAGLGPLHLAPFHPPHPLLHLVSLQSDLSMDDEEAEGEEGGGGETRQGLGWGEETPAQGLGGPQMVRWLGEVAQKMEFFGLPWRRSSWLPSSGRTV